MINSAIIFGAGYVGSSLAVILSKNIKVYLVETDKNKLEKLQNKISPIDDPLMQDLIDSHALDLVPTDNFKDVIHKAQIAIMALPTNFDDKLGSFNTEVLENTIEQVLSLRPDLAVVIKSTVPIGFTERISTKLSNENIIFIPEFLREGNAIHDQLNPSRIIIGSETKFATKVANLLQNISKNNPTIIYMSSTEAEAVKLFANSFLAARISYFNELDTFCMKRGLNAKNIVQGISLDPRIGDYYNNPSFGYGGYCLPKDTKQLNTSFEDISHPLISSILNSNTSRKREIMKEILSLQPKCVGIYRLVMKEGSENFRESAILEIIDMIGDKIDLVIFEPNITHFREFNIITSFSEFVKRSDIIIANRIDKRLEPLKSKVFSRDLFGIN